MLDLRDFFHLPQVDALVEQLASESSGLVVVAGLDPLFTPADANGFVPSGRAAIFRILMRQMMTARPRGRTVVVAESRDAVRIPHQLKRQIEWAAVEPPFSYADRIAQAIARQPDLLVIDRLDEGTAAAALEAARHKLRVLAQLDTVFSGAGVARHLLDLGAPRGLLEGLRWIVAVQRVATLCPSCKQPDQPDPTRLEDLRCRYPTFPLEGTFFRAAGCAACRGSGREGNVAAFDFFRATDDPAALLDQPSLLPLEEYFLQLAALGHVPLDDVVGFERNQLRRTYSLLTASERALAEANAALQRKLAQIEAANQVLQQRTEALISLQDIGHTLVTLTSLDELASRVCRHARDLCGAERAILYFLRPDSTADVLAVCGWSAELIHQRLDAAQVLGAGGPAAASAEPTPFTASPPGVLAGPELESPPRAGLRVPLISQHEVVGLMIVQTSRKAAFAPGEVALLQAFANQAALAIQRTGLIDALRDKIEQLEAAQVELVQKERLERELELARQVQQRLLPRIFPMVPGYAFAARCEPARRVGGDFYDVVLLDADWFGVVIADVSDKGMPAALFMALTRSLILAEARRERSPRKVLTNVHRLLLELGEPDMFVTVFYGVVDVATRRLTFSRAGHDRPLLLRKGEALPLGGEGTFLGVMDADKLHLSEEEIDLQPGDRLVLYTDGLMDAVAADGQPFGLGRLVSLLQSHAGLAADDLCAATFADLAAYQGQAEQYDDMTMLAVEVNDATT